MQEHHRWQFIPKTQCTEVDIKTDQEGNPITDNRGELESY